MQGSVLVLLPGLVLRPLFKGFLLGFGFRYYNPTIIGALSPRDIMEPSLELAMEQGYLDIRDVMTGCSSDKTWVETGEKRM